MPHRFFAAFLLSLCAAAALAQTDVAPGIRLIRGAFVPGQQPDGNSVVIRTRDGLVVFDTGRHPAHTQKILDFAKSQHRPIVAVVNSHWHLDHIGGNEAVRHAYPHVTILASAALSEARTGFLARYRTQLAEIVASSKDPAEQERMRAEMHIIDTADQLAPDVVIDAAGARSIGGHRFEVGLEQHAVTAGDVWLFDRATRTLIAGDLVTLPAPFLDTACPARWRESLDRLSSVPFQRLIPGHGPALTRAQFELYRSAYGELLSCAASDATKDICIDRWLTGTAPLVPAAEWKFTRSLMSYYVDVLRRPAADVAKLCG